MSEEYSDEQLQADLKSKNPIRVDLARKVLKEREREEAKRAAVEKQQKARGKVAAQTSGSSVRKPVKNTFIFVMFWNLCSWAAWY